MVKRFPHSPAEAYDALPDYTDLRRSSSFAEAAFAFRYGQTVSEEVSLFAPLAFVFSPQQRPHQQNAALLVDPV